MSNQPYIGLRPFERNETDIFFGREQHSDELINRLGSNHFLAVIGTSGCGKSSLVKTGLIAGLEAGYLASVGTHWKIVEMRPGQQPFQALADKLFLELNDVLSPAYTAETLQQALRQGSLSLHELLAQHPLPNAAQLLIVCDQFEEIFRYFQQGESAEARNFVSLLLASSKPYPLSPISVSHSLYVVITMRSDFLGDCAQFAGLAEAINQGLYLTPRLDAQQLREAIEEPAFVFGGEVEPALVTQLLEDAGNNQDQLPLLQHVLMRLWDLATDNAVALTLADYNAVGGLTNALSRHADEVYDELANEQKRIAEVLFRNLTESDNGKRDTRRPIQLAEIIELTAVPFAEVVAVIDEFRQAGRCFLMPPINISLTDDSVIDISHESLIRQWQRLKTWTEQEADNAKNYQRLEDRAIEWKNHKTSLLQSPELEVYQQWWQEKQPTVLWAKRYGENFTLTEQFLNVSQYAHLQQQESASQQVALTLQAISSLTYDFIDELMKRTDTLPKIKKIIQTNIDLLETINSPEAIREKSVNFNKLADVYLQLGELQKSLSFYQRALNITEELAMQAPHDIEVQRDLSISFNKLANVYLQLGELQNALRFCQQSLNIREELARKYPKNNIAKRDLSIIFSKLGDIYSRLDKLQQSLSFYQKSLNIREELAKESSQNSLSKKDLLKNLNAVGCCWIKQKNYAEAAKVFSDALVKFPDNFMLLANDLELALVQNDIPRFQQHLETISLLKSQYKNYGVVPLLNYLENPKQGYQAIIDVIENLDESFKINWNFSTLQPAIQRQNSKVQKIAYLFIDYFERRIDLKTLKIELAELEKKP